MATLPFTTDEFLDVFAAYNRSFWPVALGLWVWALVGAVLLARHRNGNRLIVSMLAVQWAWAGIVYHAMFFTRINPAAWLFSALFLTESAILAWAGLARGRLRFAPGGSPLHVVGWAFVAYGLLYPLIAIVDGHSFPRVPTFGVPCPTTVMTIGFLAAAEPPAPRVFAALPIVWAFIGGALLEMGERKSHGLPAAAQGERRRHRRGQC